MARVTVEDCVVKIPNRFDLVMIASQRARNLASGAELTLDRDEDKNPVVSLREIADENIDFGELEEALITSLQRYIEVEEPEEDEMDMESLQHDVSGEGYVPPSEPADDIDDSLAEMAQDMAAAPAPETNLYGGADIVVTDEEVAEEAGEATEAAEVREDELTIHDVAAEEVDAALNDSEILHEGGELPANDADLAEAEQGIDADQAEAIEPRT